MVTISCIGFLFLFNFSSGAVRRGTFPRHAPKPIEKVTGGASAAPGEFPYQLSLLDVSYGEEFHFCGAAIVSINTAITAAHCVYNEDYDNPKDLVVVAGINSISHHEQTGQRRVVARILIHRHFNRHSLKNDIALLKLKSPFVFNAFVSKVYLPSFGQSFVGVKCVVTGWGTLSSGGPFPDLLHKVRVPVLRDDSCISDYGATQISESMMCAGEGGKDSCKGDSGGPLVWQNTLVGIVSWGYGCSQEDYPGVYTEVSYYTDWIRTNSA